MPHDPQKYLYDNISSCEFLAQFTAGRTVDDYARDRAFRSAIERELQIIGEAVMQLDRTAPNIAARISEHRNIIRVPTRPRTRLRPIQPRDGMERNRKQDRRAEQRSQGVAGRVGSGRCRWMSVTETPSRHGTGVPNATAGNDDIP